MNRHCGPFFPYLTVNSRVMLKLEWYVGSQTIKTLYLGYIHSNIINHYITLVDTEKISMAPARRMTCLDE